MDLVCKRKSNTKTLRFKGISNTSDSEIICWRDGSPDSTHTPTLIIYVVSQSWLLTLKHGSHSASSSLYVYTIPTDAK